MSEQRKPTSPLRDALRLFFRNKPAVAAAIAIFVLACVAVSGEILTGKPPTEEDRQQIKESIYVGDKVEIKRNELARSDPLETVLDEKLLPPFSRGDGTGKFYLLGTDHLGRNVASRLWAGSTISLTIGFLAVGIMALLGITLGGIAGFWGRERVRLPFFAMLLLALGGAIAYGADFDWLAWLLLALSCAAFVLQLAVVAMGRRWRPLAIFGVILAMFLAVNGYNQYIERTDPNGRLMRQARVIESHARETMVHTRAFGVDVKDIDDRVATARSRAWRIRGQADVEVMFSKLDVEVARFAFMENEAGIELLERTIVEREARAEHMDRIDRPARAKTERESVAREKESLAELKRATQGLKDALVLAELELAEQQARRELAQHDARIAEVHDATEPPGSNTEKLKPLQDERAKFLWPVHVAKLEITSAKASHAAAAREREIATQEEKIKTLTEKDDTKPAALDAERKKLASLKEGLVALKTAAKSAESALEEGRKGAEAGKELSAEQTKEIGELTLQKHSEMLERRATMRRDILDSFKARADTLFSSELNGAKLLSGHWRYGTYRVTRHFIAATLMWLGLLVAVLMIAGTAQGAIQDVKGPLQKLFLPTMTVDDLVMRFTEIMITIPTLFLILAVLALFERDVYIVMAVIGLTGWMGMTRFVRAEILSLREQDFVQAARALGVSDYRIIWRHLVPNAISPVLVAATIGVAGAVLAESTLSFLGIGAKADQPTWGQILNDGRAYMTDAWWLMVIPGFAILVTVLSFNLLGEGLREAFNPKLRGR
ncbi:MAG: ABC transporter permease subunit [Planctomycetes bacterium]|nr:ABC transporter permease subunit [Planctomycetota bacterium]